MEYIIAGIIGFLFIIIIVLIIETKRFKISQYEIYNNNVSKNISSINGMKIAFFSDLHVGRLLKKEQLKKRIAILESLNADIYIFGGDLLGQKTNKYYSYEDIKECFIPLKNKCLLAVYGNHEYKNDKGMNSEYKMNLFESMGFRILKNESYTYHKNNKTLTIYGMNEYNHNIEVLPTKKYDLIICHEGDIIDKCNNQIMLSGHTHGGQIRIPFIPIYYRPKNGKKYTYGHYKVNDNDLIVSSGIGYGKLKIRLFIPCEIVLINYLK